MNNEIINLIKHSNNIVILTHQKPDGDAIGSSLSMYNIIKYMNKTVDVILQDVPQKFNFLKNYDKIINDTQKKYDLGIILDCSNEERIGQESDVFKKCEKTICIDHHKSNTKYCNINLIEPEVSSCCQVLYYFFKENNIELNESIGTCLLTGLLTDTNGYSNNNVDEKTMQMANELIKLGVDHYNVYQLALNKQTKQQNELNNLARQRLVFYQSGKIAYTYLMEDDMKRINASYGDHEGIVEIGRNIEGVEVSLFIREDNGYRYSLRSNGNVNVREIAEKFNGGGHDMAAGGTFTTNYKETTEKIIDEIKKRVR